MNFYTMKNSVKQLIATTLVGIALAACTPIQAPTTSGPAPETTADATVAPDATTSPEATASPAATTPAPDRAAVAPLDAAECEAIRMAIAGQFDVEWMVEEAADFASDITGLQGTACTLSATGTGEDFGNFVDAAQRIREIFTAEGWTENSTYMADGPTGTASGYELENKLALVRVDWEPSAEVDCPDDQPISECDVEPSQQLFTVIIELVQLS